MDVNYMVRGADGKEYGPVSLSQLNAWIGEGRIQGKQEVKRSDMDYWVPAENYTELNFATAVTAVAAPGAAATYGRPVTIDAATAAQLKSGASWFYWIAGLSMVNSIVAFTGSSWRFILGLGLTQILDGIGESMGGSGKVIALVLDLVAAGILVFLGIMGHKAHTWAFILGIVLVLLDGVIFVLAQDWIGVAFHAFVVYCLFRGFSASRRIRKSMA